MSHIPKIEPIKVQEFEVKQSKYEMAGKLPTRAYSLCTQRTRKNRFTK